MYKSPGYVTKISLRVVCILKVMSVSAVTEIVVCKKFCIQIQL